MNPTKCMCRQQGVPATQLPGQRQSPHRERQAAHLAEDVRRGDLQHKGDEEARHEGQARVQARHDPHARDRAICAARWRCTDHQRTLDPRWTTNVAPQADACADKGAAPKDAGVVWSTHSAPRLADVSRGDRGALIWEWGLQA